MDRLRHALKESLCDLFDKERLPASQPEANAFAMVLTSKLGSPYIEHRAVLYGSPHKDDTRQLLRKVGLQHEPFERMVDYLLVDKQTETLERPIVACEAEMYPQYSTEYTFELSSDVEWKKQAKWRKNGYVWDFWKLLHFRSPHLLFVARCNKGHLEDLKETLRLCASEYNWQWRDTQLNIVLLPVGKTEKSSILLGEGVGGEMVQFEKYQEVV